MNEETAGEIVETASVVAKVAHVIEDVRSGSPSDTDVMPRIATPVRRSMRISSRGSKDRQQSAQGNEERGATEIEASVSSTGMDETGRPPAPALTSPRRSARVASKRT